MVKIDDILDRYQLERDIRSGWIDRKMHPQFPSIGLICYSKKAQIENYWTPETTSARGLIYDLHTLEVLGRGMPKFMNLNQPLAPEIELDDPVWYSDKLDGSLIIFWQRPDGEIEAATKGAFRSDQAIEATRHFYEEWTLDARDEVLAALDYGMTWVGELIGPSNRVVLDYAADRIAPIGVVDNTTGRLEEVSEEGPVSLRDLLAMPDRENAEGWVIRTQDGEFAKIKQARYLELHRMVSNMTPLNIWRLLSTGSTRESILGDLPDEFHAEAGALIDDLLSDFVTFEHEFNNAFAVLSIELLDGGGNPNSRKDVARVIGDHPEHLRPGMWLLFDEKPLDDLIWKRLRPRGDSQ